MEGEVRVGEMVGADGTFNQLRGDKTGSMIVQAGSGDLYESTNSGDVFGVCNQAPVAITSHMDTTYTGLVVGNTTGTGKDLVILGFGMAMDTAVPTAATCFGLMTGAGDSPGDDLTPRNRFLGGPKSVAWASDGCTLPGTPVLEQPLAYGWAEADTVGTLGPLMYYNVAGSMIITPGYFVAAQSVTGNSACPIFSFLWKEVDRV